MPWPEPRPAATLRGPRTARHLAKHGKILQQERSNGVSESRSDGCADADPSEDSLCLANLVASLHCILREPAVSLDDAFGRDRQEARLLATMVECGGAARDAVITREYVLQVPSGLVHVPAPPRSGKTPLTW